MSTIAKDDSSSDTLEYLLGVISASREQRCAEICDAASIQSEAIVKQAHSRVRARMHHHILALREKYRERVTSAYARNQTLIRQQQQVVDKELLDMAWPLLRQALQSLWDDPVFRQKWLDSAIAKASSVFLMADWCIEYPANLTAQDIEHLKYEVITTYNKTAELAATDEIKAGIRIRADGTTVDATLDGLLRQRAVIEAMLISRIKKDSGGHD